MLRLYDTRTRQVETIEPARRGRLSVYSCGPTVYRPAHVGNLRSYLLADLIRRNAERHRLLVTSCQNITDVGHLVDDTEIDPEGEDKVLVQARAEGKSPLDLARYYEEAFHSDCAALNIHPADSYPRASESIGMMIDLIARLIETGHAYAVPSGSVYFDARSFPSYGELSGNRLGDLRPGRRGGTRAAQPAAGQPAAEQGAWTRRSASTRTGPSGKRRARAGNSPTPHPGAPASRAGTPSAPRCHCTISARPSTCTPAASTCASRTTRTSGPSPTQ